MADSQKAQVQEAIKAQGEVVRKLKAEKAEKDTVGTLVIRDIAFQISVSENMYLSN